MSEPATDIPLFVDLDGTLIKTDSPAGISTHTRQTQSADPCFCFRCGLLQGRAGFKQQVAARVSLANCKLPLNEEFYAFLGQQKDRELILISASNQKAVDEIHKDSSCSQTALAAQLSKPARPQQAGKDQAAL